MNVKEIEDHKFDDLKLKLEAEIENLDKYVKPAELSIEELELKEKLEDEDKKPIPLSEEEKKKLKDFKDEIELLEKEIKERQDKIDLIDKEVKLRVEIREMIDNALKDLDFEEEEVQKNFDIDKNKEEVEYKVPLINQFLHNFKFFDEIEIKEEDEEGVEVVKEVKHFPWDKEAVLKDLKLKLDLDKANLLVRNVKDYKHNKKKGELENKLKVLMMNNVYYREAFGWRFEIIKGEKHNISEHEEILQWDKDDLILFEEKILKLELAKKHVDEKEKKEKPLKERKLEYKKIDDLLFEALVEKHEEGRPEKMEEYLKLRKEIKDKHPLED
jgi:hypothetical protein